MNHLIDILMPPLIGAFIGYMTNYIAIRMLFRPLRAWRLFGLRIPFTPGIIPARRHELAAKMGRTVGRRLVTAQDAIRALERETFQHEISDVVRERIDTFLTTDLGTLDSILPSGHRNLSEDLAQLASSAIEEAISEYLQSDHFERQVRYYVKEKGDELLSCHVDDVIPAATRGKIAQHVNNRVQEAFSSPDTQDAMARFLDRKIEEMLQSGKTASSLVPAEVNDIVSATIREELPRLLARINTLLENPHVRKRLTERLQETIADMLSSLRGLTGVLGRFVNPDRLYEQLPGFIDKAAMEIAEWLREETTREQVAEHVVQHFQEMLDKPVHELVEKIPEEKISHFRQFLREEVPAFTRGSAVPEVAGSVVSAGLNRARNKPLRSILQGFMPGDEWDQARESIVTRILRGFRSEEARKMISDVLQEQCSHYVYQRRIGRLYDRLSPGIVEQLPDIASGQLLQILRRELPFFIESLNVDRMVEEKVNTLPILDVEAIVLDIMRRNFFYIHLFGGVLGFMIGLLSLLW